MGSIKQLEIDMYGLAQANGVLEEENNHLYNLISLHRDEIEELKEDLAHEIDGHTECHKAFDIVLEGLGSGVADLVEDRDFWQRSFDELSAHTIQLQVQLNDARNSLAVAEFLQDQAEDSITALGVQVVAFADLKAGLFDAFANAAAGGNPVDFLAFTEDIARAIKEYAPDTFEQIYYEYEAHMEFDDYGRGVA